MSSRIRPNRAACALFAAALVACTPEAPPATDNAQSPEATHAHQSDALVADQALPHLAALPAPEPGASIPLEVYFSGRALEAIQLRGQPAPQVLVEEIATHAGTVASAESCRHTGRPEAAHLIDLDGDGESEVLSFYELSGCDDAALIRVLNVLRDDGENGWASVLDAAVSVVPGDRRPILEIREGAIVVAGGDDGMGGTADAEVITLPAP